MLELEMDFIREQFAFYPELFLLWISASSISTVPSDDELLSPVNKPMAVWACRMYELMPLWFDEQSSRFPPIIQRFVHSINLKIQQKNQRSIVLEQAILSLAVLRSISANHYAFFSNTPIFNALPSITDRQCEALYRLMQHHFPSQSGLIKVLAVAVVLSYLDDIPLSIDSLTVLGCPYFEVNSQFLFLNSISQIASLYKDGIPFPSVKKLSLVQFDLLKQFCNEKESYRAILFRICRSAGLNAHDNGTLLLNRIICDGYFVEDRPIFCDLTEKNDGAIYQNYLMERLKSVELMPKTQRLYTGLNHRFRLLGRLLCIFTIHDSIQAQELRDKLDILYRRHTNFVSALRSIREYEEVGYNGPLMGIADFLNHLRWYADLSNLRRSVEDEQIDTVTDAISLSIYLGMLIIGSCVESYKNLQRNQGFKISPAINFNYLAQLARQNLLTIPVLWGVGSGVVFEKETGMVYPEAEIRARCAEDPSNRLWQKYLGKTSLDPKAMENGLNFMVSHDLFRYPVRPPVSSSCVLKPDRRRHRPIRRVTSHLRLSELLDAKEEDAVDQAQSAVTCFPE